MGYWPSRSLKRRSLVRHSAQKECPHCLTSARGASASSRQMLQASTTTKSGQSIARTACSLLAHGQA